MEDEETPQTYTPRRTRSQVWVTERHGETVELPFRIIAGTEYEILDEEKAQEVGLKAPVDNGAGLMRLEAFKQID